ncbi:GFA family protein [Listeria sp. ILCC797]|uniref:GFA family protein n=1 Tax=Listeria sp. ILCC797 TaxID=1918333 RepID=UPI000B5917DD|nr:GFA family protein [Listeria sp. ILCC797]
MGELDGRCLCGAVNVSVNSKDHDIHACHCEMCRKWTAGPFLSISGGLDVIFSGEENMTRFSSSKLGERGFCKTCGSTLFWHNVKSGEYFMNSELFVLEDFRLVSEIYIDCKPDYYSFSEDTKKWTEEEVLKS